MIAFILGLFVGNCTGMTLMALVTAGRIADDMAMRWTHYDRKGIPESDKDSGRKDKPKD